MIALARISLQKLASCACLLMILAGACLAKEVLPPIGRASWIWHRANDDMCQIRTTFVLEGKPSAASILITADNGYELYVKTGEGTIHFIPYHAIASASFPLGRVGSDSSTNKGM